MARSSERRRVAELLHATAIHVLRYARQADRQSPVGPAQLSALSVLVFGGPRTLRELAEAEQVAAPTMTRIVQGLSARRLVRLERSAEDARAVRVEASAKGVALLEKARALRLDLIERLLSHNSSEELAQIGSALRLVGKGAAE